MKTARFIPIALVLLSAGGVRAADLLEAARSNDLDQTRTLLARGADVERTDAGGNTSLIIAAASGHTEVVRLLLAHGARVDARGRIGNTALLCAAQEGHAETAALLLAAGADAAAANTYGSTPLQSAVGLGHAEVAAVLRAASQSPWMATGGLPQRVVYAAISVVALVGVPLLTARLASASFATANQQAIFTHITTQRRSAL